MKKSKEQLEFLVDMQKHKTAELISFRHRTNSCFDADVALWQYFTTRIGNAKMKLNHYQQLLSNITVAEQLYKETEYLFKKQSFKVGDKVMVKDGWQNSEWYIPAIVKYIGCECIIRHVYGAGYELYRIEDTKPEYIPFFFPPEALELVL
jgi:hypothetical protein